MTQQTAATFGEYFEATRDRPVYVVLGVQGSGTNLLSRILTRTFGFSVLRDGARVFNAAARLGQHPDAAAVSREIARFRSFVEPSRLERKLGVRHVHHQDVAAFSGVLGELRQREIAHGSEFARLIYAYRTFSLGMREMAIKSDDIWEHLQAINTVLPNRRIILITRDFRDNLLSVGGKHFGPVEPLCAAQYVKRRFAFYDAEYRRAGANAYHVKFETLVESPRQFVDDFAHKFSLVPVVDPDAALGTIRKRDNKIAKWRSLDATTLRWCEGLLGSELQSYGYDLTSTAPEVPPRQAMLAAHARDVIRRTAQKIRRVTARLFE